MASSLIDEIMSEFISILSHKSNIFSYPRLARLNPRQQFDKIARAVAVVQLRLQYHVPRVPHRARTAR